MELDEDIESKRLRTEHMASKMDDLSLEERFSRESGPPDWPDASASGEGDVKGEVEANGLSEGFPQPIPELWERLNQKPFLGGPGRLPSYVEALPEAGRAIVPWEPQEETLSKAVAKGRQEVEEAGNNGNRQGSPADSEEVAMDIG